MQRDEVLIAALRAASKAIQGYDPKQVTVATKANEGDLVTAADLASEQAVITAIKNVFPDDTVISEETPGNHNLLSDQELPNLTAWIIDPIDGTNNFKRGMAYSGISIGYIEAGKPVLGGILDPYRDLLYMAKSEQGATCNGEPITVSGQVSFSIGTRVCTSNSMAPGGTQANLQRYAKLGDVWVDVLGSAVLIMADIASGRLDLFHHNGLKPWDNAAGFLLAQEAGARIVGLDGQPINWLSAEVVMGNPELVELFLEKLSA